LIAACHVGGLSDGKAFGHVAEVEEIRADLTLEFASARHIDKRFVAGNSFRVK
jgi:hypothetical protein